MVETQVHRHRRTGQHPFGGADRVLPEWIQWGGGGSSRNFQGSIFIGEGGSSRHFPGSIFCGAAEFFHLTPVKTLKLVLFKHVVCFARIISTLCPNSCRQTARIGGGQLPPLPPPPSRTPMCIGVHISARQSGTGWTKKLEFVFFPHRREAKHTDTSTSSRLVTRILPSSRYTDFTRATITRDIFIPGPTRPGLSRSSTNRQNTFNILLVVTGITIIILPMSQSELALPSTGSWLRSRLSSNCICQPSRNRAGNPAVWLVSRIFARTSRISGFISK